MASPWGEYYEELEEALKNAVIHPSSKETTREFMIDKNGEVVRGGMQTETTSEPNPSPAAILKLLGDRIGGPQDYC